MATMYALFTATPQLLDSAALFGNNVIQSAAIASGAITAGKYAAGSIVNADISAGAAITPTKLDLSATWAFTGTVTFNSSLPTSTQTPNSAAQLTTKTYVDTLVAGTRKVRTIVAAGTYTVVSDDAYLIMDSAAGVQTVQLPAVGSSNERVVSVKRIGSGSNNVTVQAQPGETIDGVNTYVLVVVNQAAKFVCNGAVWAVW